MPLYFHLLHSSRSQMLHFSGLRRLWQIEKQKLLEKFPVLGLFVKCQALKEISRGILKQKLPTDVHFDLPHVKIL